MTTWLLLFLAIMLEVIATSFLKTSDGFNKLQFGGMSLILYAVSFYLLSIVLRTIPLGVAYAIWSGVGILTVTLIGLFIFKDNVSTITYLGIIIIAIGTIITSFTTTG